MNRKQKICLWVGIIIIVAIGLYPPWVLELKSKERNFLGGMGGNQRFEVKYFSTIKPGVYAWLNDPPENAKFVDLYRLGVQYVMVVIATTGLILIFRGKSIGTVIPDALKVNQTKKPAKKFLMFILFLCVATLFFVLGATFNYYVNRDKPQSEKPKGLMNDLISIVQQYDRNLPAGFVIDDIDLTGIVEEIANKNWLKKAKRESWIYLSDIVQQLRNSAWQRQQLEVLRRAKDFYQSLDKEAAALEQPNHPQRRVDLSDLVEQVKNSEPNKQ